LVREQLAQASGFLRPHAAAFSPGSAVLHMIEVLRQGDNKPALYKMRYAKSTQFTYVLLRSTKP